ncbi:hypothetical protein ACP70R_037596 [Stipagrostis hirtigluma subsp. patula]
MGAIALFSHDQLLSAGGTGRSALGAFGRPGVECWRAACKVLDEMAMGDVHGCPGDVSGVGRAASTTSSMRLLVVATMTVS